MSSQTTLFIETHDKEEFDAFIKGKKTSLVDRENIFDPSLSVGDTINISYLDEDKDFKVTHVSFYGHKLIPFRCILICFTSLVSEEPFNEATRKRRGGRVTSL